MPLPSGVFPATGHDRQTSYSQRDYVTVHFVPDMTQPKHEKSTEPTKHQDPHFVCTAQADYDAATLHRSTARTVHTVLTLYEQLHCKSSATLSCSLTPGRRYQQRVHRSPRVHDPDHKKSFTRNIRPSIDSCMYRITVALLYAAENAAFCMHGTYCCYSSNPCSLLPNLDALTAPQSDEMV